MNRLKVVREHLGLNQSEFSAKTGISQPNLSRMELGKREFGKRLQEVVIRTFDVNPVWWETGEGDILQKKSKLLPIRSWSDLLGVSIGYDTIQLFSDCSMVAIYTGPDFDVLKKGTYAALRATTLNRVSQGALLVASHREGSFAGYLVGYDPDYVTLKNQNGEPFKLERLAVSTVFRVVGVMGRVS